jgi:hypothetical protein
MLDHPLALPAAQPVPACLLLVRSHLSGLPFPSCH